MDTLPPELIEIVFSHITMKQDILSSRYVSKGWKCYVERFVHVITATLWKGDWTTDRVPISKNIYKGYKGDRSALFRGMGEYQRFMPKIFQVLPQLKSTDCEGVNDLPLILEDIQEIPPLARHTIAESLDVYLIKYPEDIEASPCYDYERVKLQTRSHIHNIAREFFTACFQFLQHYRHHDRLSFSARCDIPYSKDYPCIERITFRWLRGTIIISGIDVVNGEFAHMKHFRDSDFMVERLRSIASHVEGLSTWFLRFDPLWGPNLFPHLTTIRVYRQTFDTKIFSILAESPTIYTLIHTYRTNSTNNFGDTLSIGLNILRYTREMPPSSPCMKPVNLILPFYQSSLELMMERFPNTQSIGILNLEESIRVYPNNGYTYSDKSLSSEHISSVIDSVRAHGIKHLRIYSRVKLNQLPVYTDLHIEPYIQTSRY